MKTTVRNRRFTQGMVLFLLIILTLCVSSAYYLNKLSEKTNAILTQNHYSVVYAQEMTEGITSINQEIIKVFLTGNVPDRSLLDKGFDKTDKALSAEENNITEVGEQNLVSAIKDNYRIFRTSLENYNGTKEEMSLIQEKYRLLYSQLISLAQMNEKAIEEKTNDAKSSAKKSLVNMSLIGAFCFLIAYGFTFSFSSYFNERFKKLYQDIMDLSEDNYQGRLYFPGDDEIAHISVVFNKMAEEINDNREKNDLALHNLPDNNPSGNAELAGLLEDIKTIEEKVTRMLNQGRDI